MKWLLTCCEKASAWMNGVAAGMMFLMMMLTVVDVILRFFGKPILGSYELVSIVGATIIGLAIPKTSLDRGHVSVDVVMEKRSGTVKRVVFVLTRIPGIALFVTLTFFLAFKGYAAYRDGEVSSILQIPHQYLAYSLAAFCFMESLVLMFDIVGVCCVEGKEEKG
jgi:TRAP-type C4-dicarboxylate transport system permease small subunit